MPSFGLIQLSVFKTGKCLQSVSTGPELILHPHVVFASCKRMLQTGKEYSNSIGLHIWMGRNQLITIVLAVQIQQVALFAHYLI